MKIAHVVSTFPPYKGGTGNAAAQFAGMHALRHEVVVMTPSYGKRAQTESHPFQVEWLKSPLKYGNAACLPQLLWRLRAFDVVHLHYPFYGAHLAILLACLLWRCNLVLHYHMDSLAAGLKGRIFGFNRCFVFPLLARRADIIIGATLDFLAHSQISSYFGAEPRKFREIPYWVDTGRFYPEDNTKEVEVSVLFVGGLDRAHYFKGFENLLRAMKMVIMKSDRPLCLRVVGGGELLSYYQGLAEDLGIADKVDFLGKVKDEDLPCVYRKASFLVLPSINQGEAFGLVLLEAMSSGIPVIASNLPGVRSVFVDGQTGLVVRVGDLSDLADKISTLVADDALRSEMGRRARALVENKYTAAMAEKALEDICRQLQAEGDR